MIATHALTLNGRLHGELKAFDGTVECIQAAGSGTGMTVTIRRVRTGEVPAGYVTRQLAL
jgi:hypothetical protein